LDALIEFQIGDAQQVGMTIRGIEITCDVKSKELICLGRTAPVALEQQRLRLRAIVDRTSLEIFADDGLVYMPLAVVPAPDQKEITIFSRGGSASLQGGSVRVLRSIWAGH
jgi:sucrose-6-phosphate hydrolase SacC (GH32 family)